MRPWSEPASDEAINNVVKNLSEKGIEVTVVENGKEAKAKALEMIPEGSMVMTMTSVTLDTIGLSEELNKANGKFKPVRDKLYAMDRKTQALEMNRLGSAPQYAVGSVHAVTEDGRVLIVSNTGSQLPAYAYGALNVIWVVGSQKIVKDLDEATKRVYEYTLPLESERARKVYKVKQSAINKILIIDKESVPGRIKMILVKEKLGF